jgi:uncharacterized membrane protein YdjX (TVP38/TMEM64 family)
MNHDAVFWGVIIAFGGSFCVGAWLLFMLYRNATRKKE